MASHVWMSSLQKWGKKLKTDEKKQHKQKQKALEEKREGGE